MECIGDVLPGHLVGSQYLLGAIEGFLRKLFDVGLASGVIDDGIIVCALVLRCLKALDQRLCKGKGIVVCIV